ncbi:hypothetical protein B0H66DRAFT_528772 [Apodospora peruviana]|uniref:Uncharacterized protein n=1 Tax=Apodospora peruviana TaxID=516989 RepID=A0AAE0IUE3_9PEZI|nr:hypothetical protein B0H66DRAFT_528772 [Apodospora peruviana]
MICNIAALVLVVATTPHHLAPFGDGNLVNITGTVEEVYHQMTKIDTPFRIGDTTQSINAASHSVKADSVLCDKTNGWEAGDPIYTDDGVKYLRNVPRRPVGVTARRSSRWARPAAESSLVGRLRGKKTAL